MAKVKSIKKNSNLICKMLKNKHSHVKVLQKRFHLNGQRTIGFRPETHHQFNLGVTEEQLNKRVT